MWPGTAPSGLSWPCRCGRALCSWTLASPAWTATSRRRLRRLPGLKHARYIALTGYGQENDCERSARRASITT